MNQRYACRSPTNVLPIHDGEIHSKCQERGQKQQPSTFSQSMMEKPVIDNPKPAPQNCHVNGGDHARERGTRMSFLRNRLNSCRRSTIVCMAIINTFLTTTKVLVPRNSRGVNTTTHTSPPHKHNYIGRAAPPCSVTAQPLNIVDDIMQK